MNGTDIVVATQDTASFSDSGNIFLDYSDWFSSVSDNEFMSFGLVDNVKVFQLPAKNDVELSIDVARADQNITINFSGTLEQAASITGPWTPVENAASPYQQTIDSKVEQMFYRVVR